MASLYCLVYFVTYFTLTSLPHYSTTQCSLLHNFTISSERDWKIKEGARGRTKEGGGVMRRLPPSMFTGLTPRSRNTEAARCSPPTESMAANAFKTASPPHVAEPSGCRGHSAWYVLPSTRDAWACPGSGAEADVAHSTKPVCVCV